MTPGKHVCLITTAHLSSNPRLIKEADALSDAGYQVTVVATTYQPDAAEMDRTFANRPWRITSPLPFGPHAPRGRRFAQVSRHRIARLLLQGGIQAPAVLHAALHPVTPDLIGAAKRVQADLYIGHLSALPAAALAARRNLAPYAFDAEDFHLGELESGPSNEVQRRAVFGCERLHLGGSAYITAASPGIAGAYAETYDVERPEVTLNVFPLAHAPERNTASGSAPGSPSVYWFSQTVGPNRGLETAVRALALASSRPHLYLRGQLSNGYQIQLEDLARAAGVGDRLHFLPKALPSEMERLASAFDVGLCAEPGHTANNRIALTNKLFTYLLAGLPVVASDIPAQRDFAPSAPEAVQIFNAADPGSLARALDGYLGSAVTLASARKAAFQLGREKLNWDIEKHRFLACVTRVIGAP